MIFYFYFSSRETISVEREIMLDGTAISAAFDNTMDMGIVGTTAGTLWYINWSDNSAIRLVSGHKAKVNITVTKRTFLEAASGRGIRATSMFISEVGEWTEVGFISARCLLHRWTMLCSALMRATLPRVVRMEAWGCGQPTATNWWCSFRC